MLQYDTSGLKNAKMLLQITTKYINVTKFKKIQSQQQD